MTYAVDPRKAKFAKRCPRCGYDEWHVMRQHRQCAKCGWKEITVMPLPANAPVPEPCEACRMISVRISKVAREGGGDLKGQNEQIIRIPPQSEEAKPTYAAPATGDKEHVKDKALGAPTDDMALVPTHERAICVRCSRRAVGKFDGDWLCKTCQDIAILDAPPTWREKAKLTENA